MNAWSFNKILTNIDKKYWYIMNINLTLIQALLIDWKIDLPEPIAEIDIDSIDITWFSRKKNAALYFNYDIAQIKTNEYSVNLLKDNKVKSVINPAPDQILELVNDFLGKS